MRKFALIVLTICVALPTMSSADVLREVWWGAGNIDDAIARADNSDVVPADQVDILAEPTWEGIGDNYTARMTGWLTVPADGEYILYVSGDDLQRLYVSQDDNPFNAVEVARVDEWTASQDWTKEAGQASAPMTLTEGQVLAFVGIMQEGGGGDGQDWGWIAPGTEEIVVIPGANFVTEYEVTAAGKPKNPSPADGATGLIDVVASWVAPEGLTFDVYAGADPAALELFAEGLTEATLDAGTAGIDLELGLTYYWQVMASNGTASAVWSFTTEAATFAVEGIIATTDATSGVDGGTAQQTVDGSGLDENDGHSTASMEMWLGKPAEGELVSITYEFLRVYKMDEMLVWNSNTGFEMFLGYGFKDVTIEISVDGVEWTVLADVEFAQAPATEAYAANTTVDFAGAAAKFVKLTANTNWSGGAFPDSGLSEVRFMYIPAQARLAAPADGATVAPDAVLDWYAGRGAVSSDVYINDELAATVEGSGFVPALVYGMPYTWMVDENDGVAVWEGDLWSFSTAEFGAVAAAQTLVFDNSVEPFLSEVQQAFDPAIDLTAFAADTLQLSFTGNPVGYAEADGVVTIGASGSDIWGSADQFRFAYQSLTGDADLVVRVDSIDGTHSWAKAGLMIRQNTEGGSINAATLITGGSGGGATFQWRTAPDTDAGGNRALEGTVDVDPGYYARLVREGNTFTGYLSVDGVEWLEEGTIEIEMTDPVLVGLAVTSHDSASSAIAQFSEITAVGDITGDVTVEVVGSMDMPSNDATGLYLAVEDAAGQVAMIANPDPGATQGATTQQWSLPLAALADVDLTAVVKIAVGAGDPANLVADGTGTVAVGAITVGTPMSHNVLADVTGPDDVVVGVPNDGDWPDGEIPDLAIDNDVNTKFLHFKGFSEPTGIQVAPAVGPTVVTALTLTTANDSPERDPASFEVYGSNESIDGPYELIAAGDVVDFIGEEAWPRFTANATPIEFENTVVYTYYQVLFPTVRDAASANSMQIAEIELIGVSSW